MQKAYVRARPKTSALDDSLQDLWHVSLTASDQPAQGHELTGASGLPRKQDTLMDRLLSAAASVQSMRSLLRSVRALQAQAGLQQAAAANGTAGLTLAVPATGNEGGARCGFGWAGGLSRYGQPVRLSSRVPATVRGRKPRAVHGDLAKGKSVASALAGANRIR